MQECNKYIGLDVHKDTITVALAESGAAPPQIWGTIENTPLAVERLLQQLSRPHHKLKVWYEAGPCGYGIYRQVRTLGHECEVVAPSLIPRKAGVRVKTDHRDALQLVGQGRAGELTAVWVPDEGQEAMRDLSRAREDMKIVERQMVEDGEANTAIQNFAYLGHEGLASRQIEMERTPFPASVFRPVSVMS